ncbi:Hypothetical protein ERGA_CDS_03670 [Ehrlichia ruminantium str. Gardel]|uniref:hypothetical protein n=1 Tax=Ehrlichia ruminantium TaxID=779 RepID=UPI00004C77BA|nr:hypothetical protein [Ehrlichia ruminantium]CAI27819.1 Hypothetical protein ERGA_CDS_03670 [Ehrlichia ruminantium str. Gardel]
MILIIIKYGQNSICHYIIKEFNFVITVDNILLNINNDEKFTRNDITESNILKIVIVFQFILLTSNL